MKDKWFVLLFIIVVLSCTVVLSVLLYKELQKDIVKRQDWNNKVNNCVMNNDYRKDCKLIIYKDKQIRNKRIMITTSGDLVLDIGE